MPKDCIPIREVKVGETANESLNIVDYSYRAIGQRVAQVYVDEKDKEKDKIDNWIMNLMYFFLGAIATIFINDFTFAALWLYKHAVVLILTLISLF